MSGTSSGDNLQERADHEAGHIVAAYVLGILESCLWVTAETSRLLGGETMVAVRKTSVVAYAKYLFAGAVAQVKGRCSRDTLAPEELVEYWATSFFVNASLDRDKLKRHSDYTESCEHEVGQARDLIEANWPLVCAVSKDLCDGRLGYTLYDIEPMLVIDKARGDDRAADVLSAYRRHRREIEPPSCWVERYGSKPFFESVESCMTRVTGGPLRAPPDDPSP